LGVGGGAYIRRSPLRFGTVFSWWISPNSAQHAFGHGRPPRYPCGTDTARNDAVGCLQCHSALRITRKDDPDSFCGRNFKFFDCFPCKRGERRGTWVTRHATNCDNQIERGDTYPMVDAFTPESFTTSFFSNFACVMVDISSDSTHFWTQDHPQEFWNTVILGCFYVTLPLPSIG